MRRDGEGGGDTPITEGEKHAGVDEQALCDGAPHRLEQGGARLCGGWAQVQRHGTWMRKEEVLDFMCEYHALLGRYGHPRESAPEGARPVSFRFYAVAETAAPEAVVPEAAATKE